MSLKKYEPYLKSIALPLAVGTISAFITMKGMPYYQMQEKPFFTPPNIVFPIVWTALYTLMGISAARIRQSNDPDKTMALKTYLLQLGVNFFWSVFFFGLHRYFLAFLWLLLLIFLVIRMIKEFADVDIKAAKLQIPYLIWCCFAAVLNFNVWWLNR
jgi:tryptophan-rich sensory protein